MDYIEHNPELDRLVADIEAAGGLRLGWPASQGSGRYAVEFNSGVFADPQLASSGYLPSMDAAVLFAAGILRRLRALEDVARRRPDFDDRGNGEWRAYATVVSERRDPAWGESGDPVYERDHDPDLPPAPPIATATTTEETAAMTTTTTATIDPDAGLGTAGRGCISGLMIDWESSVEARQDPETFIAWLQAQAAAATQRAQMVPELVAQYHGRGPSGQAGVPEPQIVAFAQGYAESAQAEADAYGQWAAQYAAYVEQAQEDMTSSYGREVIGAAHAAHHG